MPKSQRGKRGRGLCTTDKSVTHTADKTLVSIKESYRDDSNFRHVIRVSINRLKKEEACHLVKLCISDLKVSTIDNTFLFHIILDLCRNSFQRNCSTTTQRKATRNIAFTYTNNNTPKLKLSKICNNPNIATLYPYKDDPPEFMAEKYIGYISTIVGINTWYRERVSE